MNFLRFSDIHLIDGEEIPTADFLQSCFDIVPFFDTLSPTAFAPVKADITGNIEVGYYYDSFLVFL